MPTTTAAPLRIGYALSSEEHSPTDLIEHAKLAEQAGFDFLLISDHFHPWIDARATARSCGRCSARSPQARRARGGHRRHVPDRAYPPGDPRPGDRDGRIDDARAVLVRRRYRRGAQRAHLGRALAGVRAAAPRCSRRPSTSSASCGRASRSSHYGEHFTVVNARIYDPPPSRCPSIVCGYRAEGGRGSPDGSATAMVVTSGDKELVEGLPRRRRSRRPRYGQRPSAGAATKPPRRRPSARSGRRARSRAWRPRNCRLPTHFEQLTKSVTEDQLAEHTPCGPDIDRHVASLQEYVDAGVDHVYVHQVGPDQAAFIEAYAKDVLPRLRGQRSKAASAA